MAGQAVPHFHNDGGHKAIKIGSAEFMCIGANPPFDHPHIYLDMGNEPEIVCPYCSTLFVYDSALGPGNADKADCIWNRAQSSVAE